MRKAGNEIKAARKNREKFRVEGLVSSSASFMTACCVPQSTVVRLSIPREKGRDGVFSALRPVADGEVGRRRTVIRLSEGVALGLGCESDVTTRRDGNNGRRTGADFDDPNELGATGRTGATEEKFNMLN